MVATTLYLLATGARRRRLSDGEVTLVYYPIGPLPWHPARPRRLDGVPVRPAAPRADGAAGADRRRRLPPPGLGAHRPPGEGTGPGERRPALRRPVPRHALGHAPFAPRLPARLHLAERAQPARRPDRARHLSQAGPGPPDPPGAARLGR